METARYLACVTSNESAGERVRRDILETLAGLQSIATGLPFPAMTEGYQWKLHQFALSDADYFIFVVGGDYGPLSETGLGFLHRAYASARATKKPLLILHCAALSQARDAVDQRRLNDLLVEMERYDTVIHLDRARDIREPLEQFVDDLLESGKLNGWQPVNHWVQSEVANSDLRQQIQLLRSRLDKERPDAAGPAAGKTVPAPALSYRVKVFREGNLSTHGGVMTLSWLDIFSIVAPLLTEPQRETDWKSLFEERLLRKALPDLQARHPQAHGFVEMKLDGVVFDDIKRYFRQQGWLLHADGIWQLSALGEDHWLRT